MLIASFSITTASGEPPLTMAANVLFAVKSAIQSALDEIGQDNFYFTLSLRLGFRLIALTYFLDAPATVESVQTSCLVDPAQFFF